MRLACTRTYTDTKSVINHRWRREYVPTMPNNGYSVGLNCVQYRRYSLSSVSLVFTAQCFRMLQWCISFFARGRAMSLFTNLLKITFVFSPFSFLSALFIPLRARSLSLVIFLFPLSRYKICSNANGGRNTKDKIFALETGEFNLLLRSRWGRRRKNNRLWCAFVRIISATRTNSFKTKIILGSLL